MGWGHNFGLGKMSNRPFTVVYVVAKPLIEAEGDLDVIETSI